MRAAELVAQLAAAGTPPELLAAVAQELFAGETERRILAERRENERNRKARSRPVTGHNVTACDTPGSASQKKAPPDPLKEKSPPLNGSPRGEPIPPDEPNLKPEHVVEAWNQLAERRGLPGIRKLTEARQKHLRIFVRRNTIDEVKTALDAIDRSAFLCGENDRGWRADFDFLLQPKSFAKLIEGAYDH